MFGSLRGLIRLRKLRRLRSLRGLIRLRCSLPSALCPLPELKDYKNALKALETAFDLTEELEDSGFDQVIPEEEINQLYQELQKLTQNK